MKSNCKARVTGQKRTQAFPMVVTVYDPVIETADDLKDVTSLTEYIEETFKVKVTSNIIEHFGRIAAEISVRGRKLNRLRAYQYIKEQVKKLLEKLRTAVKNARKDRADALRKDRKENTIYRSVQKRERQLRHKPLRLAQLSW